jgi:hypothetical protein
MFWLGGHDDAPEWGTGRRWGSRGMVGKQKGAGGRGAERAVGERSAAAAGCAEGVAVGRRRVVAATARRSFSSGGANATFSAGLGAVWLIRPCVARRRVYWGRGRLQSRAGSCVSSAVRDRGGTLEQSGDASGVQAGVGADSGAERGGVRAWRWRPVPVVMQGSLLCGFSLWR